jgi:hypothetical protein
MNEPDSEHNDSNAQRLRCVRQITEVDDETLAIVSAVLTRVQPVPQPTRRGRRRTAAERPEAEGSGK